MILLLQKKAFVRSSLGIRYISQQLHKSTINNLNFQRFNSTLNQSQKTQQQQPASPPPDESLLKRIPGESLQGNTIQDRLPKGLDFGKEAVSQLLPRPGVPIASKKMPLSKMISILNNKPPGEPELIYECESHKLYFVFSFCFAFVLLVYGVNTFQIGQTLSNDMYTKNENNLNQKALDLDYSIHMLMTVGLASLPVIAALAFIMLPHRLVRRMWFIPAKSKKLADSHLRFSTHPYFPNSPTPLITLPIESLNRHPNARIFTGTGFYGTSDKSGFFFSLREKGSIIPWIVDRKGFFWGDGRIFDILLGKESVKVAEQAVKHDDKFKVLLDSRKENEKKLRNELGFGWQFKAQGKLLIEDVNKIRQYMQPDKEIKKGNTTIDDILKKNPKNQKVIGQKK